MPAPLTWDTPGLTWDSPLATWDGTAAANPIKRMTNTKAIIDFSGYTAAELGPLAQHIHDEFVANVAVFATPVVTMPVFATLIANYNAKLAARESRAPADIIEFNNAREALEAALNRLGNYVNDVAQGDPLIVEQSGFPGYVTARSADTSAPAAPESLRLRHGDVSGTILGRYKTQRQPSTNEVQLNAGNPNTESDWRMAGIFQGQKAELSGLTPGTKVWVRVRTVGLKGVMGAWSDAAQIMVI